MHTNASVYNHTQTQTHINTSVYHTCTHTLLLLYITLITLKAVIYNTSSGPT